MNKRHYEHTLPNIRGSLSNTYKQRISDGDMEKAHEGRQKTKEKGGTESKNKPYGLAGKDVFLSPRHQVAGEGTG